jgi:glycosyltransferase involved in cell wall biosynthesis
MFLPKVSVLMPCYNAAETLDIALESLASQTLTDFEVVVIDDGSQDATPQILAEWARRDSRFRVCPQPHQGIVTALNSGLAACRAVYVARMDADDRCHPERLARQAAFLDDHPEAAVVSCLVEGFPAGQVGEGYRIYMDWLNSLVSNEAIQREIFVESPLAHPSVVFRKDWVERVGGYQERGWPEDYDLWLRLYLIGAQFAKVPEVLFAWREHPERLTRTDGRYSLENFLRIKAYYLTRGPLADRDGVLIWGAGMVGRRISKHLLRQGAHLVAFIDIDPRKIGRTRRGLPILPPDELMEMRNRYSRPALLSAVGARGARHLIRKRLSGLGLVEGQDWWGVA